MGPLQVEPKMRVGEIITLVMMAVALIGGWFALQGQVQANTTTIQDTVELIDEVREDMEFGLATLGEEVEEHHDMIIRHNPGGDHVHVPD